MRKYKSKRGLLKEYSIKPFEPHVGVPFLEAVPLEVRVIEQPEEKYKEIIKLYENIVSCLVGKYNDVNELRKKIIEMINDSENLHKKTKELYNLFLLGTLEVKRDGLYHEMMDLDYKKDKIINKGVLEKIKIAEIVYYWNMSKN